MGLKEKILAELQWAGFREAEYVAESIAQKLAPDFTRLDASTQFAIKIATHKENLVYWLGRLLRDPSLSGEATEALIKLGYPPARVEQIIKLGEPRDSLGA